MPLSALKRGFEKGMKKDLTDKYMEYTMVFVWYCGCIQKEYFSGFHMISGKEVGSFGIVRVLEFL